MRTVLVTGGSGYIAGFCIAQLLNRGDVVHATVRSLSRETEVRAALARLTDQGERLSFHAADLSADAGWAEAAQGCTHVLHVASPFFASSDEAAMVGPARDGALRVIAAGLAAGAERIVMTSSTQAASYPATQIPTPWDESVWSDPTRSDMNAYGRSKVIAERAAWDLVDREGARTRLSVVCPGGVFGPVLGRDYSFSLTIVERLLKGDMPGLPRVGFSAVDVRDIADLHIRALDRPEAAGERFIGVEGFYWFREIADILRRELGPEATKVPTREIPDIVVRALGLVDKEVRSILGDLGVRREHTAAKAQRLLDWRPRPMAETLVDCARSLKAEGAL